jgi:exonuclease SbcC
MLSMQNTALTANRAALKSEWDAAKAAIVEHDERITALSHFTDSGEQNCFTCQQHLSTMDANALIDSQRQSIATIEARKLDIKAQADLAQSAMADAENERNTQLAAARTHDAAADRAAATVTRAETLIATKGEREQAAIIAERTLLTVDTDERAEFVLAEDERNAAVKVIDKTLRTSVAEATQIIEAEEQNIDLHSTVTSKENDLEERVTAARTAVAAESEAVEAQRAVLETTRNQARAEVQQVLTELSRRAETASTRRDQETRLAAVKKDRIATVLDRDLHQQLTKAFSPSGIPAMILSGVIEDLNEHINIALDRLSRGELAIKLSTSRETLKGVADNKLTVYVDTPTGSRPYEALSGGQKFRVDLAIRTGLTHAIARGTGTPLQTFILDEGWGTLDEKGILSTIDTLFRLSDDTNVITVSHIDAVRDAFPARVEVSKVGGNSVAEVVAA